MKYQIYFNGHYQDSVRTFSFAINTIKDWLNPLVSFTFLDPITIVEAE